MPAAADQPEPDLGSRGNPTGSEDAGHGEHHGDVRPVRRRVDEAASRRANRVDWDAYADEYQSTHGAFLGDVGFVWSPEGVTESSLGMLADASDLPGLRVLEVGCGAAQCSRWLRSRGAHAVGLDLSHRQLQHARRIDEDSGVVVPVVEGTATALPFAAGSFDAVFAAFGALQFVADIDDAVREAARVLGPRGRFAFSITHPLRWAMPDDPGPGGLRVTMSYFDRTPYAEVGADGRVTYVEHHRTLGDWVDLLTRHGFALSRLVEPEWPAGHDRVWGGWGPVRGALVPGTAILGATLL